MAEEPNKTPYAHIPISKDCCTCVIFKELQEKQDELDELKQAYFEKHKEQFDLQLKLSQKETIDEYVQKTTVRTRSKLYYFFAVFAAINFTAVVAVVLFIGVKENKLPDAMPLKPIFSFAVDIAKVIFGV